MSKRLLAFLVSLPTVAALACGSDTAEIPPDRSAENAIPPAFGVPLEGVFVSATKGDDFSGNGSASAPFKTLGAAIILADKQQVRVIACAEEYQEALTVRDGISMYGNVDCNSIPWKRVETLRATVRSPSIPALTATNVGRTTRIEGFHFVAPDALPTPTGSGATSIGGEIRDAKQLTIAFATIQAGNGSAGADGVEPEGNAQSATGDGLGAPAYAQGFCMAGQFTSPCSQVKKNPGALGGTRTCAVGGNPGPGGRGGDGRFYNGSTPVTDPGVFGGDGLIEAGETTAGTPATARGGVTAGAKGTDGAPGADGASGVNGIWTFAATGFVPGNGTSGAIGKPGQGGGGGAGREEWCTNGANPCQAGPFEAVPGNYRFASNGAGGGAGGCAGVPGTEGFGGGASIALLSWRSIVTLQNVELVGGKGGRAGKGALGLAGLPGGAGGTPSATTSGAGQGGRGGHAGIAGHGSPGPSIALVYAAPGPVRLGGKLVPGEPGEGQPEIVRDGQKQSASEARALTEYPIVE